MRIVTLTLCPIQGRLGITGELSESPATQSTNPNKECRVLYVVCLFFILTEGEGARINKDRGRGGLDRIEIRKEKIYMREEKN